MLLRGRYQRRIARLLAERDYATADALYRRAWHWYPRAEYAHLRRYHWEEHRRQVLQELTALLAVFDFAQANDLARRSAIVVTQDEYLREKAIAVRRFFKAQFNEPPNEEQTKALVCPAQHILVKARAGTGKTRTIVSKAVLAIHEEGLRPDQVLMLAFNRKAACEMLTRMRESYGFTDFTTAKTFHSLAYRLVNPSGEIPQDDEVRKELVEKALQAVWTPTFRRLVNDFFRIAEDSDLLAEAKLDAAAYYAYRRNEVQHLSVGGIHVRSKGEKWIADFLFEHGIRFRYERVFWWDDEPYRPDFTIFGPHGFTPLAILEHWGVSARDSDDAVIFGDGKTAGNYRAEMRAKRAYWRERGIPLIETSLDDLDNGREVFEALLKRKLKAQGIVCERISDTQLRKSIKKRYWNELTSQMNQFIQRAKNRRISPTEAKRIWRTTPRGSLRVRLFWGLAARVYAAYERLLKEEGKLDFQDLLEQAAIKIDETKGDISFIPERGKEPVHLADLRWLLIDEYQDFSLGFDHLVKTMRRYNPQLRLFCVGDDWQTINRFAGSEPYFFRNFTTTLDNAAEVVLRTNHRSQKAIVETSNRLMRGHGEPGTWLSEKVKGQVLATCIDAVQLPRMVRKNRNGASPSRRNGDRWGEVEALGQEAGDSANRTRGNTARFDPGFMRERALTVCATLITSRLKRGQKVAHLNRTNWIYGQPSMEFAAAVLQRLPESLASDITIDVHTVHNISIRVWRQTW